MNKKLMVLSAMLGWRACWVWRRWAGRIPRKKTATDRLDNAAKVLHEVMATPDKGIPE